MQDFIFCLFDIKSLIFVSKCLLQTEQILIKWFTFISALRLVVWIVCPETCSAAGLNRSPGYILK